MSSVAAGESFRAEHGAVRMIREHLNFPRHPIGELAPSLLGPPPLGQIGPTLITIMPFTVRDVGSRLEKQTRRG